MPGAQGTSDEAPRSGKIFVSYRVEDSEWPAARIRDALVGEFGEDSVFYDGESLHRGDDWREKIDSTLAETDVMVLVIGPRWMEVLEVRAAKAKADVHRQEISVALQRDVPIVVTLVDGAGELDAARLPRNLRKLSDFEAQPLPRKGFARHVPLLIEDVVKALARRGASVDGPLSERPRTVTVAEYGDADFLEIAEAVAAVPPGSTILVRPGHYVDPVVIDHQVQLVGQPDGDDQVVLEVAETPALSIRAERARVSGLRVVSAAAEDAVAIEVTSGRPIIEECEVGARDHDESTGIRVRGAGAAPIVRACRARAVSGGLWVLEGAAGRYDDLDLEPTMVGVMVSEGAAPTVHGATIRGGACGVSVQEQAGGTLENVRVEGATEVGIMVQDGSDPTVVHCTVVEPRAVGVAVQSGGRGTFEGLDVAGGSAGGICVVGGAEPTFLGARVRDASVGILVKGGAAGRFRDCEVAGCATTGVSVEEESAPHFEDLRVRDTGRGAISVTGRARPTFTRTTAHGGSGVAIDVGDGAAPTFAIVDVTATAHRGLQVTGATGTYEDVTIAMGSQNDRAAVCVQSGADPLLRRLLVRGGKAAGVVVHSGARGTIEEGEVTGCKGDGILVDGQADPLVRAVHVHHVKGDGLNTVKDGRGTYEDCELDHVSCSGIRLTIDAAPIVRRARIHDIAPKGAGGLRSGLFRANGIRIEGCGAAVFEDCTIERTRHDGIHVAEGASPTIEGCTVDGEPFAG